MKGRYKAGMIHLANSQRDYPACNPRPQFRGFQFTNDINEINCKNCVKIIKSIREAHEREKASRRTTESTIRDQHSVSESTSETH